MISKSQVSFIKSLHLKKFRKEHHLFIAEGIKSVTEFIHSDYKIDSIFCTSNALSKVYNLSQKIKFLEVNEADLAKITALTTPQDIVALIKVPEETAFKSKNLENTFSLILDGIQDPGNMGTIIRTADWFGFKQIICSHQTVDVYNPKVVQATMGSLPRINAHYVDLDDVLSSVNVPVFGALLEGDSIYNTDFGQEGVLILGNEGNGISENLKKYITKKVMIPRFGNAESLNVAISAAIFCSEMKRNYIK